MKLRYTPAGGFEILGLPLGIDARRSLAQGIVTHAHTDHAARHRSILCTPETALLLGERWKSLTVHAVPYGKTIALDGARLTFHPAGHILGSAMIELDYDGTRLLFTGDLRTKDSIHLKGARPVGCDILVIESTFGRPEYVFPEAARIRQMMRAFVDAARASGYTPVLTGYAMGKAQEIVALLASYHEPIWVHPKIAAFCEIYRRAGVKLPEVEVPTAGAPIGSLVVMPPNFARTEWRERVPRPRVCFCSGWAMDRTRGGYHRYDQAIPLSDHADCASLVEFARETGAGTVYTMHGFSGELAELLRGEGLNASSLPLQWSEVVPGEAVRYSTESLDLFES